MEDGLWELVAAGLVTADGDNLRALIDPKASASGGIRSQSSASPCRRPLVVAETGHRVIRPARGGRGPRAWPGQLLQRYGIVFRDLLARESMASSWRDLLVCYRRPESTGEIRGGRFVKRLYGRAIRVAGSVGNPLRAMKKRPGTATSRR